MWDSFIEENKHRQGVGRNYMHLYIAEFIWQTKLNERDSFDSSFEDILCVRKNRVCFRLTDVIFQYKDRPQNVMENSGSKESESSHEGRQISSVSIFLL